MRKTLLTTLMTLVWLLASPSLQLRDSGWFEVGVAPAAAESATVEKKEKPAKEVPKRVGSSVPVRSNQTGFHPMQPITPPETPNVTGTVSAAPPVAGYPNVPSVPVIGRETSQDRVARCAHQGALGGLPASEQGAYVHNCAF